MYYKIYTAFRCSRVQNQRIHVHFDWRWYRTHSHIRLICIWKIQVFFVIFFSEKVASLFLFLLGNVHVFLFTEKSAIWSTIMRICDNAETKTSGSSARFGIFWIEKCCSDFKIGLLLFHYTKSVIWCWITKFNHVIAWDLYFFDIAN